HKLSRRAPSIGAKRPIEMGRAARAADDAILSGHAHLKAAQMNEPNLVTPLPPQRHLFDIPDDVAFLNCAYISPLPKASLAAGEEGARRKARPWTIVPADFFTASETVRGLFA